MRKYKNPTKVMWGSAHGGIDSVALFDKNGSYHTPESGQNTCLFDATF